MAPKRAVSIANCSGAMTTYGDIDGITGDYLVEVNLANHAVAMQKGGTGYAATAWDGLQKSLGVVNEKRIKVDINGGGLNPVGLAKEVERVVKEKGYNLVLAYVDGDNVLHKVNDLLKPDANGKLPHLDSANAEVHLAKHATTFLDNPNKPIISANAYLGIRAITRGLREGADIIICGRVSDAPPVIAAAQWWHGWENNAYTSANFAGFGQYQTSELLNLGLPITEIESDGTCVVTKHDGLGGFVTADTVKCQLVYELQGNIYLKSDVKADLANIHVEEVAKNRVRVTGVKGYPPPPTTKLAEAQIRSKLEEWGVLDQFEILDFQRVGVPQTNPRSQLESTVYLRVFAQAAEAATLGKLAAAHGYNSMAHFSAPTPFLGYYPALISQSEVQRIPVGAPPKTEPLQPRANYETKNPVDISQFGPTQDVPLSDLVLARSGDKGPNINIGLFVHTTEEWEWLRTFLTAKKMQELMGTDWKDSYFIERVEFVGIRAVHFVIYGLWGGA
ncbi:hypothetical protein AJ80_07069 [Polytolypa hystricis UAMH7299]|uniref:Uncharacterized protein n=1 Tax=Polytolypa hystricis (strain UAMH7299) TaxID=1447883 RepID=A0A2B7XRL2_POLH7|nr:hypothetical protein AJ80_07069 [Polytolypa hystricis UAMH7299]